ncbi:MAG: NADH-quinone oxidoreductase subunit L [Lachnospiraceae bacterium]|nr:NADH-quinone oxidoreductase subunit L [Lachnospiraceae bacterium]
MSMIGFLILFPFVVAILMALMKKGSLLRRYTLYLGAAIIIVCDIVFAVSTLLNGQELHFLEETHAIDHVILVGEWLLVALVCFYSFKFRKYYCALLSVVQTGAVTWLELTGKTELCPGSAHIMVDHLTIIMCLIVGVVGGLIVLYAMGYMRLYAKHHTDVPDRRSFFFAVLFVFLGAMHGLIFSDNMLWIYFFWEITSVCSFLLIGYSQTEEATNNSFRALWMNLLGGLGFAVAIIYATLQLSTVSLQSLIHIAIGGDEAAALALVPVAFLAFAGLTKSAQMPFSRWLLGAMVAPTPTSALLHSATMVKAGVYLLLRLGPAMTGNQAGLMITLIGGFTFFAASCLAIAQSDGKKVLAYSTISNLGLITACAGIGTQEAIWSGIFLMIFHAVSKSLLFLTVGAIENSTGSRNVEDMHGLIVRLPNLAYVCIVGIMGMFLAPFGMLVAKWAALISFVDSRNVLLMAFLCFGSATTLFYWGKWLCTIIAVSNQTKKIKDKTKKMQWVVLGSLAAGVILLCITFPLISSYVVEPYLADVFETGATNIIGLGNTYLLIMMVCLLLLLPLISRILGGKREVKLDLSYMGGINEGDNRTFTDSFGEAKEMYLSNWYITEWFGEDKMLGKSLILSAAVMVVLLVMIVGGVIL